MAEVRFTEKEKTMLREELEKLMEDWLDYLEYDEDESVRERLFAICYLRNLIANNKIDMLTWDDNDPTIYCVEKS